MYISKIKCLIHVSNKGVSNFQSKTYYYIEEISLGLNKKNCVSCNSTDPWQKPSSQKFLWSFSMKIGFSACFKWYRISIQMLLEWWDIRITLSLQMLFKIVQNIKKNLFLDRPTLKIFKRYTKHEFFYLGLSCLCYISKALKCMDQNTNDRHTKPYQYQYDMKWTIFTLETHPCLIKALIVNDLLENLLPH